MKHDLNFTAIDFETANRKRTSACAIGLAKVREGKVIETFYSLLTPEPNHFEYQNTAVHGIKATDVEGKPTLFELWPSIQEFIGTDVLVAHNINFEQSVINQTMELHNVPLPENDYLCTMYMAKVNYPRLSQYRLNDLCRAMLGKEINHHNALEDAIACAELGCMLIGKFPAQPIAVTMSALYVDTPKNKSKALWRKTEGIKPTREEFDPNHPLFEKRIVLTGELEGMTREEAVLLLVDVGAIYQDNVTLKTDFLLVGQEFLYLSETKPSGKYKTATQYNNAGKAKIQIIDLSTFKQLVMGAGILPLFA